jgi:hypothetical protein
VAKWQETDVARLRPDPLVPGDEGEPDAQLNRLLRVNEALLAERGRHLVLIYQLQTDADVSISRLQAERDFYRYELRTHSQPASGIQAERDALAAGLDVLQTPMAEHEAELAASYDRDAAQATKRAEKAARAAAAKHTRETVQLQAELTKAAQRLEQLEAKTLAAAETEEALTREVSELRQQVRVYERELLQPRPVDGTPLPDEEPNSPAAAGQPGDTPMAARTIEPRRVTQPSEDCGPASPPTASASLGGFRPFVTDDDNAATFVTLLMLDLEHGGHRWREIDLGGRFTLEQLKTVLPATWSVQPDEHPTRADSMLVYRTHRRPLADDRMLRLYRLVDLAAFVFPGHRLSDEGFACLAERVSYVPEIFTLDRPHILARARWRTSVPVPGQVLMTRLKRETPLGRATIASALTMLLKQQLPSLTTANRLLRSAEHGAEALPRRPVPSPDTVVRIQQSGQSSVPVPPPAAAARLLPPAATPDPFRIDQVRLAAKRAESFRAQAALERLDDELVGEGEPDRVSSVAEAAGPLGAGLRDFAEWLSGAESHDLRAVREVASRLGLQLESAVPAINAWAEASCAASGKEPQEPAVEVDNTSQQVWVDEILKDYLS